MGEEFLNVSDEWRRAYPGAAQGILVMDGVVNPPEAPQLDWQKEALEAQLRERYASYDRASLLGLPILQAYHAYYKGFDKTYHLLLQLESVVFKHKSIPRVAALVEVMFMAELEDLLLTAGHDLAAVRQPLRLDVADGEELYTLLRGDAQQLKRGDIFVADAVGVISSILYGPDARTQINPDTHRVFFTTYAPPGIGSQAVLDHLGNIERKVIYIAPTARVELLKVVEA